MTDTDNAAEVIRELAFHAADPDELEAGAIYCYQTAAGPKIVNLRGDEYRDFPVRKRGTVVVSDVDSFAHYYGRHADEDSEVFADTDALTVTAVLDAHRRRGALPGVDEIFEPRWQEHRLILGLNFTPEWKAWHGNDRGMMPQARFAEFIEDHIADIADLPDIDGPCDGAELLEMAQQFQAHTKVDFKSGHRISSGQAQFSYVETTEASAGDRGSITIPTAFALGIRVFEDLDPYLVKARFRYRITDGKLTLGYHLDDPERKVRDAVQLVVAKVSDACAITIMSGRP